MPHFEEPGGFQRAVLKTADRLAGDHSNEQYESRRGENYDEANDHGNRTRFGARFHGDCLEPGAADGAWEDGNGGIVPNREYGCH